ncbi:AfsR/SARP family transcriptional regulator [Nocardia australiensis]|uniref:AfsR/SARP family transcriptional regulator n=1 Tax=Nocardia australiensis TaxID=2887191 RepID=UPI001D136935|nr:BTAD domain-containing putative transcriptional regulator [Nocardia australiensis]
MTTGTTPLAYDDHGMFPDHSGPSGHSPSLTTPTGESVVVALLGEVALRRNGALAALPGARSRLLLAALALRPGRSRSAQALIDDVWGEQPPRAPMNALHTQVSRLRAALPDGALEIGPAGYRLILPGDQVDLTLADELVRAARKLQADGDHAGALAMIARARSLWRGEPGADLPAGELADELGTAAAWRLAELSTIEVAARVAGGDLDGAAALTRRSAAANPLGEGVHATLMRLLVAAGRSNEALDVFASIRARLVNELGVDPGAALVALNTAILRGDPIDATGSDSVVNVAATNSDARVVDSDARPGAAQAIGLRAAPNALLGRVADLAALEQLLHRSRVTTVLGPGGTGKTRVANELGARVARGMPVVMVELASVRPDAASDARSDVESAISVTLGLGETVLEPVRIGPGQRVVAGRRLQDALAARAMLLILDNCEHLIDAVAEVVADLVGSCDQLTVLTTSRAPLAITAETVYPLSPLAIDAAGSPATDLFMARARAVRPAVRLDPVVVARLCGTLDGLPLAIELAAARVRTMSVEEIESRLGDRFALLRSGDRSSPERHRTLHAVIAWSWNLLDGPQQVTLRRMCRMPAGFTLTAAETVAGGPEVDDVAAAVDGLVAQSLLTVLEEDDGTIGIRYRMLETVREFGEEQLALAKTEAVAGVPGVVDEGALVLHRMTRWARDFSVTTVRRYQAGAQIPAVLSTAADLDNLVAVLRYSIERRDAGTVYRVYPVVATLWVMRGAHPELVVWARRVMELPPERQPARGTVADLQMLSHLLIGLHGLFLGPASRTIATVRARARRLLATGADFNAGIRFLGVVLCAKPSGVTMARLFAEGTRSSEDEVRTAALFLRMNAYENSGRVFGSTRDALSVLKIVENRDPWGTSMVSQHLGQLHGQTAHYTAAVQYYRRAVDMLSELRAHEEMLEMRGYLVVSLTGSGQFAQARAELDAAVGAPDADPVRLWPVDDPSIRRNPRLAGIVAGVAELELAEGDFDAGMGYYYRALELHGWPTENLAPGPGNLILASAIVGAHVLHGHAASAVGLVHELAGVAADRLQQYFDLPQIGSAGFAVGSYHLATGKRLDVGFELLALALKVAARQDYPSMEWQRHLDLHRAALGAEPIDEAISRVAPMRRIDAAQRIIDLLYEVGTAQTKAVVGDQ